METVFVETVREKINATIIDLPECCQEIGWYHVKSAEIKREGELVIYV